MGIIRILRINCIISDVGIVKLLEINCILSNVGILRILKINFNSSKCGNLKNIKNKLYFKCRCGNLNPFASIGRTGTSKGKVKVMVICLNISFMTWFTSFFHSYMKKSSKSSLKKRSRDISLEHKNQASYKFSKNKLLYLAKNRAGTERVKNILRMNCMLSDVGIQKKY